MKITSFTYKVESEVETKYFKTFDLAFDYAQSIYLLDAVDVTITKEFIKDKKVIRKITLEINDFSAKQLKII